MRKHDYDPALRDDNETFVDDTVQIIRDLGPQVQAILAYGTDEEKAKVRSAIAVLAREVDVRDVAERTEYGLD